MENQERKSMHGEVIAANLNEPMEWAVFLRLSEQSQKDYIMGLRIKYNASVGQLAELFNVKKKDLVQRAELLGLDLSGARPTRDPEKAKAWEDFLGRKPESAADTREPDSKEAASEPLSAAKEKKRVVTLCSFSLLYTGTLEGALSELELYADVLGDQTVTVSVDLEVG